MIEEENQKVRMNYNEKQELKELLEEIEKNSESNNKYQLFMI